LCGWTFTGSSGPPRGFLARPESSAPSNTSKLAVLVVLEARGWSTVRDVAAAAQLTLGQTAGVLNRCVTGRFAERSAGTIDLVPRGKAHSWNLAPRGVEWLAWARG